jgi:hypothetical protein
MSAVDTLDPVIRRALVSLDVAYENPHPGHFFVTLPGTQKLATHCWIVVGDHSVLIEAFVMRCPDEAHDRVHSWCLTRNARMFAVSWAIDAAGDLYLVGRLPHSAITEESVDQVLGAVLDYADSSFNALLELGFGSAIKREWAWRVKAGESLRNLEAFARFATAD